MKITKTTCNKKSSKNVNLLIGDYTSNIQIKGTKESIENALNLILDKAFNNLFNSTTLEIKKYLVAALMCEETQSLIYNKIEKLDKLENHHSINL